MKVTALYKRNPRGELEFVLSTTDTVILDDVVTCAKRDGVELVSKTFPCLSMVTDVIMENMEALFNQ